LFTKYSMFCLVQVTVICNYIRIAFTKMGCFVKQGKGWPKSQYCKSIKVARDIIFVGYQSIRRLQF